MKRNIGQAHKYNLFYQDKWVIDYDKENDIKRYALKRYGLDKNIDILYIDGSIIKHIKFNLIEKIKYKLGFF